MTTTSAGDAPVSVLAPLVAGSELTPDPSFPLTRLHRDLLDVEIVGFGSGLIELRWRPGAALGNSYGFVHGGFVAMVLDDAAGMAALPALGAERGMLTAGLNIQYLRPVLPAPHRVLGRAVRVGRNLILGDAEVVDDEGRLCARVAGTFVPRPAPPRDAPGADQL